MLLAAGEINFTAWYILVGALLVVVALSPTLVKRLPLSTSIVYLAAGVAVGPLGLRLIRLDPVAWASLLERLTEIAVIVSLFTAGLKLRTPLSDPMWRLPVRLATFSMTITVGLVAAVGYFLLDLPLGAAVLLGAVLAPTDPVLASDVQVADPADRDRLRFSLTGEAAFPFVMLGLGLLGLRDLGAFGWRWFAVDLVWAIGGGLLIGWAAGTLVARLVLYLRRTHKEAVGLDDFLSLGLLALAYGLALAAHAYGFLAVFAAGVALRRIEAAETGDAPPPDFDENPESRDELATHPEKASAFMAHAVLGFNEQLERIAEVAVVLIIGGLLTRPYLPRDAIWFVPLLLLVIRPASVVIGLAGARLSTIQWPLICWFGIRGVGSLYYLMFAVAHGGGGVVDDDTARRLTGLTLTTIAASIAVHGLSVTPLMKLYTRVSAGRRARGGNRRPRRPARRAS
jgi:NhaP-type Na+/H+ or K+/H+ antiporter